MGRKFLGMRSNHKFYYFFGQIEYADSQGMVPKHGRPLSSCKC